MKWIPIFVAAALLMACSKPENAPSKSPPEKKGFGPYKVPPQNDHNKNKGF
jgi:hypothetical protein